MTKKLLEDGKKMMVLNKGPASIEIFCPVRLIQVDLVSIPHNTDFIYIYINIYIYIYIYIYVYINNIYTCIYTYTYMVLINVYIHVHVDGRTQFE